MARSKQATATPDAPARTIFDQLTTSALEFASDAAVALEKNPRLSVIHMAAAIELALKSRLVLEHWTLVVAKPDQANLEAFLAGSFESVNLRQAVDRLKNVGGESLSAAEWECFDRLHKHRNRLIHFTHSAYVEKSRAEERASIASEQCRAWFYLRTLMGTRWSPRYVDFEKLLRKVDRQIGKNKHFLAGKFAALQPAIAEAKKAGSTYEICASCGYEAARVIRSSSPLITVSCELCARWSRRLSMDCPSCGKIVETEDPVAGLSCDNCGTETNFEEILSAWSPDDDPKEQPTIAYCTDCEHTSAPTVILLSDEDWICLACLTDFRRVENCDYCGELVAGLGEASYFSGCVMCRDAARGRFDDE